MIRNLFSILYLSLILITPVIFSCSHEKNIYSKVPFDRVTFAKNDTLLQFYTKPVDGKIPSNIAQDKFYTWYRADSIFLTKGGFSGKLLHGDYMELYPDKALKEKGKYNNGLKEGVWQSWFQNGERESVITWSTGLKSGKFQLFTADGQLLKKGNYKGGKEEGEFSDFLPDGKIHRITYKEGKMVNDTLINRM